MLLDLFVRSLLPSFWSIGRENLPPRLWQCKNLFHHRLEDRRAKSCSGIPSFHSGESEGVVAAEAEGCVATYGGISEGIPVELA